MGWVDTNGDGMPDAWEQLYGFDREDASDAAEDADEDGYSNLQEYEGGTNPQDENDYSGNSVPDLPENLDASPNPSTDGSFELAWDALSAGTTPTGYLVYLEGSSGGALAKIFSALSLSISGLDNGSYVYKVYACTGTEND